MVTSETGLTDRVPLTFKCQLNLRCFYLNGSNETETYESDIVETHEGLKLMLDC